MMPTVGGNEGGGCVKSRCTCHVNMFTDVILWWFKSATRPKENTREKSY